MWPVGGSFTQGAPHNVGFSAGTGMTGSQTFGILPNGQPVLISSTVRPAQQPQWQPPQQQPQWQPPQQQPQWQQQPPPTGSVTFPIAGASSMARTTDNTGRVVVTLAGGRKFIGCVDSAGTFTGSSCN